MLEGHARGQARGSAARGQQHWYLIAQQCRQSRFVHSPFSKTPGHQPSATEQNGRYAEKSAGGCIMVAGRKGLRSGLRLRTHRLAHPRERARPVTPLWRPGPWLLRLDSASPRQIPRCPGAICHSTLLGLLRPSKGRPIQRSGSYLRRRGAAWLEEERAARPCESSSGSASRG